MTQKTPLVFDRPIAGLHNNIQDCIRAFQALGGPKVPKLDKGNCLIFSLLFWLKNPLKSKIVVKWNSKRNVPSFWAVSKGITYIYKPRDQEAPFSLIFRGIVHRVHSIK